MNYKHPVDTMSIENLLQNKIKYNSMKGTKVVMPYKGTIKNFDSNVCGGKLEIKHKIDGKKYNSVLCGVESPSNNSSEISQGEKIGEMSSNNLIWMLVDEAGDTQNIYDIFKNKDDKDDKDNKSKDNKSKENKYKPEKPPEDYGFGEMDPITKRLFNLTTKPLELIGDFLGKNKKDKKDGSVDEENLKEEIERIKQLLK